MSKKKLDDVPVAPKYEVFNRAESDNLACIKIVEGEFKDFIYHYGVVSVGQADTNDGSIPLNYTFDVVEGLISESNRERFDEITASILYNIVTEMANEAP